MCFEPFEKLVWAKLIYEFILLYWFIILLFMNLFYLVYFILNIFRFLCHFYIFECF